MNNAKGVGKKKKKTKMQKHRRANVIQTELKSTLITAKFLSCMMYNGATWRPGSHGPKHFEKFSFL